MYISKSSFFVFILLSLFISTCKSITYTKQLSYKGKPFFDSVKAISMQKIPGKLECEFYDMGGEGIAYHDMDNKNSGSGNLNKGNDYLNTFRLKEAVDISFTKYHDSIDNSIYNVVQPQKDQLYLGWTEPDEWVCYTVEVQETAQYKIGAMYTSNRGGAIRLSVDGMDTTPLLDIPSTFNPKEPINWRQWHHWNYIDSLAILPLRKGKRIIKLEISKQGNFNFDYFSFEKVIKQK